MLEFSPLILYNPLFAFQEIPKRCRTSKIKSHLIMYDPLCVLCEPLISCRGSMMKPPLTMYNPWFVSGGSHEMQNQ